VTFPSAAAPRPLDPLEFEPFGSSFAADSSALLARILTDCYPARTHSSRSHPDQPRRPSAMGPSSRASQGTRPRAGHAELAAGSYRIERTGWDEAKRPTQAGILFVRFRSGQHTATGRVLRIR
jgi:hypothetical protein